jgi:hypothetical protein
MKRFRTATPRREDAAWNRFYRYRVRNGFGYSQYALRRDRKRFSFRLKVLQKLIRQDIARAMRRRKG